MNDGFGHGIGVLFKAFYCAFQHVLNHFGHAHGFACGGCECDNGCAEGFVIQIDGFVWGGWRIFWCWYEFFTQFRDPLYGGYKDEGECDVKAGMQVDEVAGCAELILRQIGESLIEEDGEQQNSEAAHDDVSDCDSPGVYAVFKCGCECDKSAAKVCAEY